MMLLHSKFNMANSAYIAEFGICFQAQGMTGTDGGDRLLAALREQQTVSEDVDCFGLEAPASRCIPKVPGHERRTGRKESASHAAAGT